MQTHHHIPSPARRGGVAAVRVLPAVLCAALAAMASTSAEPPTQFFRTTSAGTGTIVNISHNGFLVWSNSIPDGRFEIERTLSLSPPNWETFAWGYLEQATVELQVADFATPPGSVFLPGERFMMGDALGDHTNITRPVHEVRLSPFFMKRTEVTNEEMRDVLQWAIGEALIIVTNRIVQNLTGTNLVDISKYDRELFFTNGLFSVRSGREPHPAARVSWYGAVAYCNFRSTMDGRNPCYDLTDWSCDMTKNGHRLPTEAEWEYAARGGYTGLRFPWSHTNVITHSLANYKSDSALNWYDVSPTQGFHPDYADNPPRSSPVGTFPPNAFGLSDMCGNVLEWVHDRYGRYSSGTQTDPTGPAYGVNRVVRGGSWYTTAERATCSVRFSFISPDRLVEDVGFRTVFRDPP